MYEGYFQLGGSEVANRQRAFGYALTGDCKIPWFRLADCPGLWDALGDKPYTQANIQDSPWWDPALPETARFFGVYTESIVGLSDATTVATSTEGILDGGVTGGVRQAIRQVRITAMLTALGMDALEAGMSWLKSSLSGGTCTTHQGSCSAQDACFFVMCPGPRDVVEVKTWVVDVPAHDVEHEEVLLFSDTFDDQIGADVYNAQLAYPGGTDATGAEVTIIDTDPVTHRGLYASGDVLAGAYALQLGVTGMTTPGDPNPTVSATRGDSPALDNARTYTLSGVMLNMQPGQLGGAQLGDQIWQASTGDGDEAFSVQASPENGQLPVTLWMLDDPDLDTVVDSPTIAYDAITLMQDAWTEHVDEVGHWETDLVPETDEDYDARVTPLMRRLHGVTTISGPLIRNEYIRRGGSGNPQDDLVAYEVEWTMNVDTPYVYSLPREIAVRPSSPAIVEDAAINRIPYTSAEIASGTVAQISINMTTNPSVEVDAAGWGASATNITGGSPVSFLTSAQDTTKGAPGAGTKSFRARILGNSTTNTTGGCTIVVQQDTLFGTYWDGKSSTSFSCWVAASVAAGAAGSTLGALTVTARFYNGSTALGTEFTIGTTTGLSGTVLWLPGVVPPAGADRVRMYAKCDVPKWTSSTTAANNSDIQFWVDAMAAMVP